MNSKRLMAPRAGFFDPYDIYACPQSEDDRKATRLAISLALTFHVLLFLIRFTGAPGSPLPANGSISLILPIVKNSGSGSHGRAQTVPQRNETPRKAHRAIPFPDPTPDDPEPLYESVPAQVPDVVSEMGAALSVGEVTSPSSQGDAGPKSRGPIGHDSSGPEAFVPGPGISDPIPILRPVPYYTEEARKARIEGIVLVECIVRKDGTVDTIRVIRGLGHGLDESAVQTISTKWRFKPGTHNGQPVDVRAYVEVYFRLF
jgi:protein TonB